MHICLNGAYFFFLANKTNFLFIAPVSCLLYSGKKNKENSVQEIVIFYSFALHLFHSFQERIFTFNIQLSTSDSTKYEVGASRIMNKYI